MTPPVLTAALVDLVKELTGLVQDARALLKDAVAERAAQEIREGKR